MQTVLKGLRIIGFQCPNHFAIPYDGVKYTAAPQKMTRFGAAHPICNSLQLMCPRIVIQLSTAHHHVLPMCHGHPRLSKGKLLSHFMCRVWEKVQQWHPDREPLTVRSSLGCSQRGVMKLQSCHLCRQPSSQSSPNQAAVGQEHHSALIWLITALSRSVVKMRVTEYWLRTVPASHSIPLLYSGCGLLSAQGSTANKRVWKAC